MTSPDGNGSSRPQTWSARLLGAFSGPRTAKAGGPAAKAGPVEVLPAEERKAVMVTLDSQERSWVLGALVLATIAGIAIPAYFVAANKVTKSGKNSIAVAPDAWLLGAVILILCVIGYLALWRRRRTFVAFDLILIGFAFTLFIGLAGFLFILLGGWLMLRAWRINKYGTTNSKAIAAQAARTPQGARPKAAHEDRRQDGDADGRPQAAHRQQALHAQSAPKEEDPQADRVDPGAPSTR